MNNIRVFYSEVLNRKLFYVPLLLFAVIAYSYSIYNRTISWDDMMRDHYVGSGNIMLSGRWGMVLWCKLFGLTELQPFADRFISLLFLLLSGVLTCYLLFSIDCSKTIIHYTVFASLFVTYPLINEIWEYGVANISTTGGICLSTLSVIILRRNISCRQRIFIASLLLILPVSSYESAAFYYISLVLALFFYDYSCGSIIFTNFKKLFYILLLYFVPLFNAVVLRFIISFVINSIYNLSYTSGGNTSITWLFTSFHEVITNYITYSLIDYGIKSLVYFPITEFVILLAIFIVLLLYKLFKQKAYMAFLLGIAFVLSLFSQSLLQGMTLPYRNAIALNLFVGFSAYYMLKEVESVSGLFKYSTLFVLICFCVHQSFYMNKLLCLNNQRSENELEIVRNIGQQLYSNFDKKPVVFVSPYAIGPWVRNEVYFDETTWNGHLFSNLRNKLIVENDISGKYNKFVETDVNCCTEQYASLKNIFSYLGYEINIVGPTERPSTPEYGHKEMTLLRKATKESKQLGMRPYQMVDRGDYIIVKMGETVYYEDFIN